MDGRAEITIGFGSSLAHPFSSNLADAVVAKIMTRAKFVLGRHDRRSDPPAEIVRGVRHALDRLLFSSASFSPSTGSDTRDAIEPPFILP